MGRLDLIIQERFAKVIDVNTGKWPVGSTQSVLDEIRQPSSCLLGQTILTGLCSRQRSASPDGGAPGRRNRLEMIFSGTARPLESFQR
jgi:hypothetical protein